MFPEPVEAIASLAGGPHILYGEGLVLDENGRSDLDCFQHRALTGRAPRSGADPVLFMAFDLLMLDGRAVIELPVQQRKTMLQEVIGDSAGALRRVEHFAWEHGRDLYQQAKASGLGFSRESHRRGPTVLGERLKEWQGESACRRSGEAVKPALADACC